MKKYLLGFLLLSFFISLSAYAEKTEEVTVNGVTFAIPEKALIRKIKTGYMGALNKELDKLPKKPRESEGTAIVLKWPDMTPAADSDDNSQIIIIGISAYRVFDKKIGDKTIAMNSVLGGYHVYSGIYQYGGASGNDITAIKAEPVFLAKHPMSGLNVYKMPYPGNYNMIDKNYYIEGNDAINPTYWIQCDGMCKSFYKLNDKVQVDYSFRKEYFLDHHRELREAITKALNSFIVNK